MAGLAMHSILPLSHKSQRCSAACRYRSNDLLTFVLIDMCTGFVFGFVVGRRPREDLNRFKLDHHDKVVVALLELEIAIQRSRDETCTGVVRDVVVGVWRRPHRNKHNCLKPDRCQPSVEYQEDENWGDPSRR